jgi:integrase/recombinase XerD
VKQARALDDKRLKQALAILKNDRERALFLLSVKAGLRAKEIAGLEWSRIDWQTGTLLLKTTKGNKPRHVPMADDLADALRSYRDSLSSRKTHVFTNTQSRPGRPLTPNSVAVWLRDLYLRKLGWTGYSSHSGRRTFVTKVARKISEAGGSLRDVQALAGHESLATTQRYIETNPEAQRRVIKLI